jgi:hypothetical protein
MRAQKAREVLSRMNCKQATIKEFDMLKERMFLIVMAALVAIAMVSPAFASDDDSKTYNGAFCKPTSTNQGNVEYPLEPFVGIRNNNGYTVPIVCPVVVDSVGNTSGTTVVKVFWTALDDNHDRIVCAIKSLNENGSSRQLRFASMLGSGWIKFDNISADAKEGSYVLDCQLPPSGMLNTIVITEKDE